MVLTNSTTRPVPTETFCYHASLPRNFRSRLFPFFYPELSSPTPREKQTGTNPEKRLITIGLYTKTLLSSSSTAVSADKEQHDGA
ncbi:uncharacterized protein ARMOST_11225 [Armillaria ostoyae]|uniref:Uncharacterized protein n=1 Tax=Armillaria ostoyae TaxID=47428 RepID=A0A284RGJ0_ARMOS|nr:uncharacterized protein ARMOST_11225 [Armillaria ostoyae]